MFGTMFFLVLVLGWSQASEENAGCLFDGRLYSKGDKIMIPTCLARMTCAGNNVYSDMVSLGGICPKETRDVDGQNGCLFDGRVYAPGDKIMIQPCLAELTCLGNNNLSEVTPLGGQCPEGKRDVDGQNKPCRLTVKCYGNQERRGIELTDGCDDSIRHGYYNTGCLFNGKVYSEGDTIVIQPCLAKLTCLGHNMYSEITMLGGHC